MNKELSDHMDNSQGNTGPTRERGPEITSKESASVSTPTCRHWILQATARKNSLAQILQRLSKTSNSTRSPKYPSFRPKRGNTESDPILKGSSFKFWKLWAYSMFEEASKSLRGVYFFPMPIFFFQYQYSQFLRNVWIWITNTLKEFCEIKQQEKNLTDLVMLLFSV